MDGPHNSFVLQGTKQVWLYGGGCQYPCSYHHGKVEWHHPIDSKPNLGLYLCEAHHSVIQGRRRKYLGELGLDKSLEEMRSELKKLECDAVIRGGADPAEVHKR